MKKYGEKKRVVINNMSVSRFSKCTHLTIGWVRVKQSVVVVLWVKESSLVARAREVTAGKTRIVESNRWPYLWNRCNTKWTKWACVCVCGCVWLFVCLLASLLVLSEFRLRAHAFYSQCLMPKVGKTSGFHEYWNLIKSHRLLIMHTSKQTKRLSERGIESGNWE